MSFDRNNTVTPYDKGASVCVMQAGEDFGYYAKVVRQDTPAPVPTYRIRFIGGGALKTFAHDDLIEADIGSLTNISLCNNCGRKIDVSGSMPTDLYDLPLCAGCAERHNERG